MLGKNQPQAIKPPASNSSLKDFDFLGKLGQGSFGVVYKVRRKVDGNQYVMKQINISKMNSRMKADAINEVTILNKLNHINIVKYYDSFIERNLLNIVMEFCEGGDLSQILKSQFGRPLKEERIWKYFILMTMGLEYIHKRKILHRDMKTMNVFLHKDDVRIGDLGVAKVLQDNTDFTRTMVGTPFYLSPEMCEERPYNEKSDIWALGCILYEMCTFKHPFEAKTQGALVLKIIRGKYNPIPTTYSRDLIDMVDMCLRRDYKTRPNATQILAKPNVIQKAQSLNINLNPSTVDKKLEYVKKGKESQKPPELKKKESSKASQKSSDIKSIQSQIVVEKKSSAVVSTPKSGAAAKEQKKVIQKYQDPSRQAVLDAKQKEKEKEKEKNYHQKQQQEIQKNNNVFDYNKNRFQQQQQIEKLKKEQEKIQKPPARAGGPRERPPIQQKEGIFNAYNEKNVQNKRFSGGMRSPSPGVNKSQQQSDKDKPLSCRNPQPIKSGAFNMAPSEQEKQNNRYPFQKQPSPSIQNKIASNPQSNRNSRHNKPQIKPAVPTFSKRVNSEKDLKEKEKDNDLQNVKVVNQQKQDNKIGFPYKNSSEQQVKKSTEEIQSERDNVARIRKGAPQQLSRQAQIAGQNKQKQLFGVDNQDPASYLGNKPLQKQQSNQKNLVQKVNSNKQQKNYDQDDYDEVMNLPDFVGKNQKQQQKDIKQINEPKKLTKEEQMLEEEKQKIFSRKLHNEDEKVIVKLLDDHFKKEEEEKNKAQQKIDPKEKTGGQQVVSDVDKEFDSTSSDDEEIKQIKQKKLEKEEKLKKEQNQEPLHFIAKKEPLDLNYLKPKQPETDQSTQLNDNEEQESSEQFVVNNTVTDQQNSDINSEDQQIDEDEQAVVESNSNNSDGEYYDDEEEQKKSVEEDLDQDINDEENKDENIENDDNDDDDGEEDDEEDEDLDDDNNEVEEDDDDDDQSLEVKDDDDEEEEADDVENMMIHDEDENNFKLKTVEVQRSILQKRFDDTTKRQKELQTLLDIKTESCVKSLGEENYLKILKFFRTKLNSDTELSNEDQEEIDSVIQQHVMQHHNPQLIYTIYKILHLEIEIDKSREKLGDIVKKISQNEESQINI